MVLHTRVTALLGIEHPIIQGGMHHVGYASLAAAVSEAGGLGTITALTQRTPEELRAEIRRCRQLTRKPFAVNLTLLPALAPPDYGAYCDVVIEEGVKIVETAGRNPGQSDGRLCPECTASLKCALILSCRKPAPRTDTLMVGAVQYIRRFKHAGLIVVHKCVAVCRRCRPDPLWLEDALGDDGRYGWQIKHALTAQRLGADCISMDGFECAGHPGEDDVGNWVLLPRAAACLSIPFVASGGVGNGRQLAAALALGAEGVNMGTRFMATVEAPIQPGIKQALVAADETSTTLVMRTLKNTERVYKNRTVREVQEREAADPGNIHAIRHLVSGENYRQSFQETGDPETSVWSAGQVMGLIDDIPTCAVLIARMVADAEAIIAGRLPRMLVPPSRL